MGKGRGAEDGEGMRLICRDRAHNLLNLGQTLFPGSGEPREDDKLQLTSLCPSQTGGFLRQGPGPVRL